MHVGGRARSLLQQSHQSWLPRLMRAIHGEASEPVNPTSGKPPHNETTGNSSCITNKVSAPDNQSSTLHMVDFETSGLSLCNWLAVTDPTLVEVESSLGWLRGSVRKLVLSATLTRHPAKLHALRLHRPCSLRVSSANENGVGAGRFRCPCHRTVRGGHAVLASLSARSSTRSLTCRCAMAALLAVCRRP